MNQEIKVVCPHNYASSKIVMSSQSKQFTLFIIDVISLTSVGNKYLWHQYYIFKFFFENGLIFIERLLTEESYDLNTNNP